MQRLRINVRDVTATHKCIRTDICINPRGALNHGYAMSRANCRLDALYNTRL